MRTRQKSALTNPEEESKDAASTQSSIKAEKEVVVTTETHCKVREVAL